MAVEDKHISYRVYLVAFGIFLVAIAIAVKLTNIQWVEGDYYRKLAKERTVKNFVILQIREIYIHQTVVY
jgi:cell division protein FtsI (penicillin-binding protein 3)